MLSIPLNGFMFALSDPVALNWSLDDDIRITAQSYVLDDDIRITALSYVL